MIDFDPWDKMLRTYVKDGQVNYVQWQSESAQSLRQWLDSVRDVDVAQCERGEAIAFLINLYNALTIDQILQKKPIESVRPKILGVPNMASFALFFKRKIYTLNNQKVSLDDIEHKFLRERFSEPRIHFALVCASQSCPPLRSEAYQPQQLETQLEEDARQFINDAETVGYDAATKTLYCSKIFKWYESDFLSQSASVAEYIQRYLSTQKIDENAKVEYLPYDWSLNGKRD